VGLAVIGVVASTVVATAGGATLSGARAAAANSTVTIRLPGDWGTLDWQTEALLPAFPIVNAGYDTLLSYAPNTSHAAPKLVPYLATKWKVSPTKLVFTIRKGAKCSDGTAVTPSVVAGSLQRWVNKSPQLITQWGPGSYTITPNDNAGTVTVVSSLPNNALVFGVGTTFIVCPNGVNNPSSLADGIAGSGPYVLGSAVHNVQASMTLNPKWTWGPNGSTAKLLPKTLKFIPINNETTAANELLTGSLNYATVAGPDVSRLLASKKFNVYTAHQYLTYDLEFDLRTNHQTADFWLRDALASVVNTSDYNKAEFQGRGITSPSFVTRDTRCFDPKTAAYAKMNTIAQAKQILTSHGYKYSGSQLISPQGKPVTISFLKLSIMASGIDYIASVWQQLGIQVTINTQTYAQWVGAALAGNWDAWVNTEYASFADPSTGSGFISGPGYPNGFNSNGMNDNGQVENMAAKARGASTPKLSCKYWGQFQETMVKDHYVLPLAAPYTYTFISKGITAQSWGPSAGGPDVRSLRVGK
jgi:peptide/nickel transport system substrate-binding protein